MSTILLHNVNFHTLKLRKIKFLSVSRQVVPVTVVSYKEMDKIQFPYVHATRYKKVTCQMLLTEIASACGIEHFVSFNYESRLRNITFRSAVYIFGLSV